MRQELRGPRWRPGPPERWRTVNVVSVVGARPQFVKAGAVSQAVHEHNRLGEYPSVRHHVLHSGQHYDWGLSGAFLEALRMDESAVRLQSFGEGRQVGRMAHSIAQALQSMDRPDAVLVYGDTDTTVAGALAAVRLSLRLVHVEAGARCGHPMMREELNRIMVDHLSEDLLCPTQRCAENARAEGVPPSRIHVVGDVMLDLVQSFLAQSSGEADANEALRSHGLEPESYVVATIHRAENADDRERLNGIMGALRDLATSGIEVLLPLHPRTRRSLARFGIDVGLADTGIRLLPPVSHRDLLVLTQYSRCVITDSGGLQKEAYWLGVPCVTLREETEWPETMENSWNVMAGSDREAIAWAARRPKPTTEPSSAFGQGNASRDIVSLLTSEAVEGPHRSTHAAG